MRLHAESGHTMATSGARYCHGFAERASDLDETGWITSPEDDKSGMLGNGLRAAPKA